MHISSSRIAKALGKKRMALVDEIDIDTSCGLIVEIELIAGREYDGSAICVCDTVADGDNFESMISLFKDFIDMSEAA
jgi:hypothetical protein